MRDLTTFDIAGKTYGVDFSHLREVLEQLPSTPVPLSPSVVRGVINLRGDLIPVLALDPWLELGTADATILRRPWMAVLDAAPYYFGVLVDRVSKATVEGELDAPDQGLGSFLEGVAQTATGPVNVIRIPSLIRHLEQGMKHESMLAA